MPGRTGQDGGQAGVRMNEKLYIAMAGRELTIHLLDKLMLQLKGEL